MTIAVLLLAATLLAIVEARNRLIDADVIREALYSAKIPITKAAIWMGDEKTGKPMDRALLERRLNGEGRLSHNDLCKLPVAFWREYCVLMLIRIGVPRRVKRAVPVVLAVAAHKRMARFAHQTTRQLDQRKERAS